MKLLSKLKGRVAVIKFFLLLAVLGAYFGYLSWQYDLATGGLVSALTWSFFVLCTPIADAGFLVDFPVRLITGMKMLYSELIVWATAIILNSVTLIFDPQAYSKSFLTSLLQKILMHPWPDWGIIVLSCIGTFLSIRFGDDIMDAFSGKRKAHHRKKPFIYRIIITVGLALLAITAYYFLMESLDLSIPQ